MVRTRACQKENDAKHTLRANSQVRLFVLFSKPARLADGLGPRSVLREYTRFAPCLARQDDLGPPRYSSAINRAWVASATYCQQEKITRLLIKVV